MMITQKAQISKDIQIEVDEDEKVYLTKGNHILELTLKDIGILANCDLDMVVGELITNVYVIKDMIE